MNRRIVEALGLDPNKVLSLTLIIDAGAIPTVEVKMDLGYLDETGENVVTELRRYKLTEIEGDAS